MNSETAGMVRKSANKFWGGGSRAFGVIGGCIAIFGGLDLALLRAAGENNLIQALANGIGYYCIGKGLFMISTVINFKAAVNELLGIGTSRDAPSPVAQKSEASQDKAE